MLIKELGEFGLIRRLMADQPKTDQVVIGAGDDAAVLAVNPGARLLVTGDLMVEGTHFLREKISSFDLGFKLMAVNLSDIAAMAGTPKFAVVFLGLPPGITVEAVEEIYRGARFLADQFGVAIVGGDTVRSPSLTLGLTLLGEGSPSRTVLRSGARPGDLLAVTGTLGGSAAGLAVALDMVKVEEDTARRLLLAHYRPQPRVEEGQMLGSFDSVHALIDISDGLASEVLHICQESRVGAVIRGDRIPVGEDTRLIGEMMGNSPREMALYGGEDYELLFAVEPDGWERVREAVERTGTRVTVIGRVTEEAGVVSLESDGETIPLAAGGYDHFK